MVDTSSPVSENVQEDPTPGTNHGKGKMPFKKKQANTTPTTTVTTRSRAIMNKRPAEDLAEDIQPPEPKRLFMEGTLGSGDNAVHVHPSSQHVIDALNAKANAASNGPSAASSAPATATYQSGLASSASPKPVKTFQVTEEQLALLRILLFPEANENSLRDTGHAVVALGAAQGDDGAILQTSPASAGPTKKSPSPVKKPGLQAAAVIKEESPGRRKRAPSKCEVLDPNLQDAKLAHQYDRLDPVLRCKATPISGPEPDRLYAFSEWVIHIPDIDEEAIMSALDWDIVGNFVNLARISPRALAFKEVSYGPGPRVRRDITINGKVALCFTPVCSAVSNLIKLSPVGQKRIVGVPHCQEFDRMIAVAGMVLGVDEIKHNFYQNGFSFTTYGNKINGSSNPPKYGGCGTGVVSGETSPSAGAGRLSGKNWSVLRKTDAIPVYNARSHLWTGFDLPIVLQQLEGVDSVPSVAKKMTDMGFDLSEGEIPSGSCVVVAHSVSATKDMGDGEPFALNLNIQWALVLGTPGSQPQGQPTNQESSNEEEVEDYEY